MSKLLFLPDRNGREKESEGAGLVRLSADTSEMAALAKRMVIRQETDEITPDAAYQGAMALALLLDSWQGTDVRLAVRTIDAQKSRFAAWVMAARPMEQRNQPIRLLMLVKDQQEALLGLVDAENGLTLAAQMGDIWDMLPERATWVNREDKCFRSPLPLLNEADCDLLLRRLHRMNLPGDRAKSFRAALNQRLTQEREMLSHSEEETLARLAIRAQAALGMMKVPGFAVLEENSLMDTENPLMQCFTAETVGVSEALKRQQVLLWHGKAFGRSSKVLGWTDTNWPDEAETLNGVEQEIALMADGSVWWNKKLADALNAFRNWLKEKYVTDEALAEAWGKKGITFGTASVPTYEERKAYTYETLLDGKAQRNAIDFHSFMSDMTTDSILYLAKVVKEAIDNKWIVGTYNGYLTHGLTYEANGLANASISRVLASPYIDFLCSPICYDERLLGMSASYMMMVDSVITAGKLPIIECDSRTVYFDSKTTNPAVLAEWGKTYTLKDSIEALKSCLLYTSDAADEL